MKKNILLILYVIFNASYSLADSQSYGPIIQRQSKQIQDLKTRVLELENTIEELKINLKQSGSLSKRSAGASVAALGAIVGEGAAEAILMPEAENTFFKKTTASTPKDKTDYDLALAVLKDGDFDSAEQKFEAFMKDHPSSRLQSNATFWYAESFYRRGAFNKAAINYLQSYKKIPESFKST